MVLVLRRERERFTRVLLTVDFELPLARDLAPAGAVVALAAEVAVELLAHVLEQELRGVDVAKPLRLPVVIAQRKLRRKEGILTLYVSSLISSLTC